MMKAKEVFLKREGINATEWSRLIRTEKESMIRTGLIHKDILGKHDISVSVD